MGELMAEGIGQPEELDRLIAALERGADLYRLLELIAETSRRVVNADSVSISIWERDSHLLRALVNVGELGPEEVRWPTDETYDLAEYPAAAALLKDGRSYALVEGDEVDPASQRMFDWLDKGFQVGVPIMVEGAMWGELYATSARNKPVLPAEAVRQLERIAERVGQAIVHSQRLAAFLHDARTDPLTGVGNRRLIIEALEHCLGESPARGALLMVDVDGLKVINDSDGHAAGDEVLKLVAETLRVRAAVLEKTTIGRLGGDEFGVVLPGADLAQADDIAMRALSDVAARARTSFSWGLASITSAGNVTDVLEAADADLYRRKILVAPRASAGAHPRRAHRDEGEGAGLDYVLASLDAAVATLETIARRGVDEADLRPLLEELRRVSRTAASLRAGVSHRGS